MHSWLTLGVPAVPRGNALYITCDVISLSVTRCSRDLARNFQRGSHCVTPRGLATLSYRENFDTKQISTKWAFQPWFLGPSQTSVEDETNCKRRRREPWGGLKAFFQEILNLETQKYCNTYYNNKMNSQEQPTFIDFIPYIIRKRLK